MFQDQIRIIPSMVKLKSTKIQRLALKVDIKPKAIPLPALQITIHIWLPLLQMPLKLQEMLKKWRLVMKDSKV
jgi:hypothetical protein